MATPTKYRKGFVLSVALIFFFIIANLTFAEQEKKNDCHRLV